MPSVSDAQAKFMRIAEHNSAFAKDHHISQATAHEFVQADKRAGRYAHEAVTPLAPSAGVSSTGYVQPNGMPPFKVF